LTKILTPKRNIDIIADAMRNREKGKPYVITFIGVNGVGKSTNLAKVAYLYKNQGFKVMLAACDNFRAGAVEQIKTHGRCLDIPVYDKGYREDPADIAFQAIREATLKKVDVLLIDTAGRMQDNEPLMRSLSRLVVLNQPDLILFIGEALVGNDATD
jgi:signal recognition particle receptor subunit alpha